jgi:uncharacterized membrane protein YdjX (TVP38/TMEM64 family)
MARARRGKRERLGPGWRWAVGVAVAALLAAGAIWLAARDLEWYRFLLRLYQDKVLLRETLNRWGILGPLIFMAIQALQVVISPIPGDVTGFLGGFVFGQWLGFLYSTIGLTLGSLIAFWVGRQLGAPFVRRVTGELTWDRLGFIVDAGGAILCFVIFLLPGVPKDIACYLFGMSPMPFWVFAVISTAGRMPGTWVLSAQGAKTAEGQYVQLLILSGIVAAVTLPLYYYRHRIVAGLHRRRPLGTTPERPSEGPG